MPPNNKVSQKQLYDTVMAVEGRLSTQIASVLVAVNSHQVTTMTALASLTTANAEMARRVTAIDGKDGAIEVLHGHVDDLRLSDRKWGGLAALIAAVGTTLAALLHRS